MVWRSYKYKKKCKKNSIYYDLTLEEFKIWLSGQNDDCHYCKISLKDNLIYVVKDVPGFQFKFRSFEIDRKNNDPSIGYRLDNICLACRVCNVKKGSEFSYEEFIEYAKSI